MQAHTAPAARRIARGLTLIEMLSVVTVVAVLAGSAAPRFDQVNTRRVLDGTATEVLSTLHFARSEAVSRNQRVRVSYLGATDGGRCMIVHTGAAESCSCSVGGVPQCEADAVVLRADGFPARAKVTVDANVAHMTIDPVRGMFAPAGQVRVRSVDGDELRHVITPAGRVRTCSVGGKQAGYAAC